MATDQVNCSLVTQCWTLARVISDGRVRPQRGRMWPWSAVVYPLAVPLARRLSEAR